MHPVRDMLGGRWSVARMAGLLMLLFCFATALNSGLALGWRLLGSEGFPGRAASMVQAPGGIG